MVMTETAKKPLALWIEENHRDFLVMRYRVERSLFSGESDFQHIDIVETAGFGRMLFNDSTAMISERDEFIYHEMISHVPLFVHPDVRRALVIGGGDGGTVREILRHRSVEHCHLVEIDPLVVQGCKEHIPQTAAALDDSRVEVTIADGVRFVAETEERYDLVIVDSTDPIGPATPLFGPEFYRNVHRVLEDGGIVVSQAESSLLELEAQRSLLATLNEVYTRLYLYNYVNMTYPGGLWSFSLASKGDTCPLADFDPGRVAASGIEFRYYNPAVHHAAFALPSFQARALADYLSPLKKKTFEG
jgi:spermidine synthase